MENKRLYSVIEVGKMLGIGRVKVYELIKRIIYLRSILED